MKHKNVTATEYENHVFYYVSFLRLAIRARVKVRIRRIDATIKSKVIKKRILTKASLLYLSLFHVCFNYVFFQED